MDQTRRPLKIPPEFSMYAEKHGIFEMYKVGIYHIEFVLHFLCI